MATIAGRADPAIPGEADRYDMILEISGETRDLLSRLAAESGGSEFDVIGKAVALFRVAIDARKEGKRIGIIDEDGVLEREVVGL